MYGPTTLTTGWATSEPVVIVVGGRTSTATTGTPWGTQWRPAPSRALTLAEAREVVATLRALGLRTHDPDDFFALAARRAPSVPIELRARAPVAAQRVRPHTSQRGPRSRRPHSRGQSTGGRS